MYGPHMQQMGISRYCCQCCSWPVEQGKYDVSVFVRAWKCGLARQVCPSRPVPAHSLSTPRLNSVLPRRSFSFLSLSATASIYTVNRDRASPEFLGSRISVPTAFAAKSPSTQGRSECFIHLEGTAAPSGLKCVEARARVSECPVGKIQLRP